jgi:Xaa-Pro dipeptidase
MESVSKRISKVFKGTRAEVIFLMNTNLTDSNFLYLTGFTSGIFEQNPLIVTKNGLILPVSPLEYEIAKEQRPKGMRIIKAKGKEEMDSVVKRYLKGKVVGINASFLPYKYYQMLKKTAKPKQIIDVSKCFYDARLVKDESEISNIKIANRIAKSALAAAKAGLKSGMTERQLAARVEYLMLEKGANGIAFRTIVAFDSNSALPHHMPDGTRLRPNSIVLIDIGAKYNNYCSDITRTFIFRPDRRSGKYSKFMEIYKIVKDAQLIGCKAIKDGAPAMNAHMAAEGHINTALRGRYKGRFIHSLGHAIGLDVHDLGFRLSTVEKLKANMVVSDEPGIYVVGFGGVRIEDDVIVTKNGAIML